jgi:hypothetical protein
MVAAVPAAAARFSFSRVATSPLTQASASPQTAATAVMADLGQSMPTARTKLETAAVAAVVVRAATLFCRVAR